DMKLFKTYEGHEPLFVLDEEEYVEDVLYRDSFRDLSANHNKHRKKICKENRQRRKRERQARKRSRSH
ncbi:MAG TPA: hypothetical protein VE954_09115, partial [Oligoflexus sp.]|uniref:hypothetical protein n=1 Tax=Oligoflexus sp. TaxID=1971216 RepID=UPI002D5B7F0E